MIFLGYFFVACAYALYAYSRFCKSKQLMLFFNLCSKPFMAAGLYFFNSLSGSYVLLVSCLMLITTNIKEKLKTRWLLGYIFFQAIYLVILYYTYIGYSSILITLCVSITLFSTWWLSPQKMRLIGGINGFLALAYHLSVRNWLGLLEITGIISSFSAYIKARKKSKKNHKKINLK